MIYIELYNQNCSYMIIKILIFLLILTSLFGYLEWGAENHSFLFEVEWDVLKKLFSNPKSVAHPFIFIPLLGQILLLITLFQKIPNKKMIYTGISSIGFLLMFMFIIGILSFKANIIISTIPFLLTAFFIIKNMRSI